MEDRLVHKIEQIEARLRLSLVQLELDIRRDMPPGPTRERLRAVERAMEKLDPDFKVPTTQFGVRADDR